MKSKPSYTIIEENGRLYAMRTVRIDGRDHEVFQRLETRDAQPRRMWWGTTKAADRKADEAARFAAELAAFRMMQKQEARKDPA